MLLTIDGVTKRCGGLVAVNNVSFQIQQGEILGLIGPNGAGKSTIFNIITGKYLPSKGKIFFQGQDVTGTSPHKLNRHGLAMGSSKPGLIRRLVPVLPGNSTRCAGPSG